jgi:hypothetical protein
MYFCLLITYPFPLLLLTPTGTLAASMQGLCLLSALLCFVARAMTGRK